MAISKQTLLNSLSSFLDEADERYFGVDSAATSVIVSDTDTLADGKTSVNGSDAMAVQEVGQSVERLACSGVVPFFRDEAMRHFAPLLFQRIDELIRHSGLAQRTTRPVSDQDVDA